MPGERRNLRSNKETSSSTNGEKARSNSQSSSAKDKPVPTRSTSSKSKAAASKKATTSGKDGSGNKSQPNGTETIENGVNGTNDVDMVDEGHETVKANGEADEEMTVVLPPPRNSKPLGEQDKDTHGDIAMNDTDRVENGEEEVQKVDPKIKAVLGIICCPSLVFHADHGITRHQSELRPP